MNWEFENIKYIYWLLLVPLLLWRLLFLFRWKKEKIDAFADKKLQQKIFGKINVKHFLQNNLLIILAFIFMVLGLMNVLIGSEKKEIKREGTDLVFVIDVSNSMNTQDVAPSRMEKAKKIIENILDKLGGDRVGIVIFAGQAYSVMPLSNDYAAAKLYLDGIDTQMITAQGTNIADAVGEASAMLSQKTQASKSIILISDGETHEGNVDRAISTANKNDVVIYSVGIGTTEGGPIPMTNENGYSDYKKDENGNIVLSKLVNSSLTETANETGGKYFNGNDASFTSSNILKALSTLNKREISKSFAYDSQQYFQFFVGFALIIVLLVTLTNYKNDFNI